jgi:hypothetical protein
MPKVHKPYPPDFKQRIVEMVGAGRGTYRKLSRKDPVVRTRTMGAGLLAMVITVGLLSGCGTSHESPAANASYQSAPCPVPNFPGVPEADLGPNYSCGYLTVPENRSALNGRTIRILVARVKAATSAPRPDPIVYLPGGSGRRRDAGRARGRRRRHERRPRCHLRQPAEHAAQ